jgi:ribosomal protein S14
MATKKKKEKGKAQSKNSGHGQFKCGKCGDAFPKAHGLAIHILRTHKKRTWGKNSGKPEAKVAIKVVQTAKAAEPRIKRTCAKCGRNDFKIGASYAAHMRFCKGRIQPVSTAPTIIASTTPYPLPQTLGSVKPTKNGHNQIERLKAIAAQKRREADEIEKMVASFEENALKFLNS